MILTRSSIVKFLFFLFLFLHAAPLITNQNYQLITILNYSIVLSLLIASSFSNKKMSLISIIYISLICISVIMSILGFSGTISSLIMAASLPHFLFRFINSKKDFLQLFYLPIILSSFLLIIFSAYLYVDVNHALGSYIDRFYLGEYFIIASINLVPLLFAGFSVLAYLLVKTKITYLSSKRFDSFILGLLVLLTIFYSSIFLTRSVLICSLILLYACFKKTRILLLFTIPFFVFYNIDTLMPLFTIFFGSDNISDILFDSSRTFSIKNLINSSLNNFLYNFDFRDQMSYSSLINLLFSMFPLTFIFLYSPSNALIKIFKRSEISLFLIFLSSFTLVIYQMDFFSIFTFFFFLEYVNMFINNEHAS